MYGARWWHADKIDSYPESNTPPSAKKKKKTKKAGV
jgi:hypothetical protein